MSAFSRSRLYNTTHSPAQPAAKKPLALFAQAIEEENDAQPISQKELINLQILESSRKSERQALKLATEALAGSGEVFDFDSKLKPAAAPEPDLPEKQTMTGKSRYLGELLKAKERRDRDKL